MSCHDVEGLNADATHIFDGLGAFPNKIAHIQLGSTPKPMIEWAPGSGDLFTVALGWLREDRELRRKKEAAKGRIRGPKGDVSSTATLAGFAHLPRLFSPSLGWGERWAHGARP